MVVEDEGVVVLSATLTMASFVASVALIESSCDQNDGGGVAVRCGGNNSARQLCAGASARGRLLLVIIWLVVDALDILALLHE